MTSGSFHSIPLSSIITNREGRQRREINNIPELADSIQRLGLINPIVVTRDSVLVTGERRLEACRVLGWTNIPAQYTDELPDHTLRAIELEENIKREALNWQDECLAVLEYHKLRLSEDPSWSQERTAEAVGLHRTKISDRLRVAQEILGNNSRVTEAPRFSTALGIVTRKDAREDEKALASFRETAKAPVEERPDSILCADFNEWAKTYDGPRFNFIHCDFPYGIGADKFNQGAAPLHGGYDDGEQTYWDLLRTLCDNMGRLCTESCHYVFWFSLHHYASTRDFFLQHAGIDFDPFPLVWLKSDNIGILPDPSRGPRRIYETAFFGSRGDRKIVRAKSNAYAAPTVRDVHMSIKPEPMLRHFFEMFVDETTIFLDPTCGSGSSLRAAEGLGAAHVLGLERNPEFAEQANLALRRARAMRRVG